VNAPDPADYGHLPGDGEFIRGIPDLPSLAEIPLEQRFDHAKRQDLIRRHTGGVPRPVVQLPQGDVQLGDRWRHLLTSQQVGEAQERGMFRHLLAGHDPDRAQASTAGEPELTA
jgi:hypothetical protein